MENLPPVTAEPGLKVEDAIACRPLRDWWAEFQKSNLSCKSIHVQSIDYFGKRVGFLKVKCDIRRVDGTEVPGIIFMRGPAVAILVVLITPDGSKHALLTRQARPAIGRSDFLEIPAGMMDEERGFSGKAAEEMQEETGIIMKTTDVVNLTDMYQKLGFSAMIPSAGGCDESIGICLFEKQVTDEELAKLSFDTEKRGVEEEQITLKVVPLDTLIEVTPDGKTLCALALYDYHLKKLAKGTK